MGKLVTIKIDGKEIKAEEGSNLLQTARDAGFDIPGLCYYDKVSPSGACRLCLVKIDGMRGLTASCTVKVNEGMNITAFDEELEGHRKAIVELLISEHKLGCMTCEVDSGCGLEDLAYRYDVTVDNLPFPARSEHLPVEATSPVILYDPNKCILCERCVKACYEIQGKGILSFAERGIDTYVATDLGGLWVDSNCDGCGECIQACPVGALVEKPSIGKARKWEITKEETICPYCGVGCRIEVEKKGNEIIRINGADGPANDGRLCVKGRFGYEYQMNDSRLTTPLIKENGAFREASWDEALDLIADKFTGIKNKYGSGAFAGLASARCTNEDNYVFQKFMRAALGTNNVDHCARLCHASTVAGLARAFGSGAMTNSIKEFEHADCILVTGSNTTETHPVIATYIKNAVQKHGAKLIVVDPRRIDLVKYATLWLRQQNGTDVAWLNGMMNVIINEGLADEEFIRSRTEGYEDFAAVVKEYTPERVEEISGIPKEQIIEAARVYAQAENGSIVFSMGITQHITGTDNVLSVANLAMLTGNVGKLYSGVNPLRGQNNVQGACDLGGLPNVYPGYQKVVDPDVKAKFEAKWNAKLDDKVGLSVTEMMDGAGEGTVKALYIMGENPMVSDPNLNHVEASLKKLDFLVVQDIFMTETTQFADVVLPSFSSYEKSGTFTNTERRIQLLNPVLDPPAGTRDDWQILQDISNRMGYKMNFTSAEEIMEEVADVSPIYGGVHFKKLGVEGVQWPCKTDDENDRGVLYLHKDTFSRGLGHFSPVDFIPPAELPDKEYPYMLSTGRILFHYHTGTMTRKVSALNSFESGPYAEISPELAETLNISENDDIRITSRRGSIVTAARITDKVAPLSVFVPFHFAEAAANRLTNDALDPIAKIPELKVAACAVEKA